MKFRNLDKFIIARKYDMPTINTLNQGFSYSHVVSNGTLGLYSNDHCVYLYESSTRFNEYMFTYTAPRHGILRAVKTYKHKKLHKTRYIYTYPYPRYSYKTIEYKNNLVKSIEEYNTDLRQDVKKIYLYTTTGYQVSTTTTSFKEVITDKYLKYILPTEK